MEQAEQAMVERVINHEMQERFAAARCSGPCCCSTATTRPSSGDS